MHLGFLFRVLADLVRQPLGREQRVPQVRLAVAVLGERPSARTSSCFMRSISRRACS